MNGKALKDLRKKHGYTREELAQKIYVTASDIKNWEEGLELMPPSSGEVKGIAEAFGIDEDLLRERIEQDFEDDYDEVNGLRFVDFLDFGIKSFKYYRRKLKDNKNH